MPVDVDDLVTIDGTLQFSDVRNSQGYVDDETGVSGPAVAQSYVVDGKFIPRLRGDFDYGHSLPIGHSSVWFRQSAGLSPRDRDQPFANFFFGGFGNNYVDHGDEKRYRDYDSLAGRRDQRGRRPQLREVDDRMEPAAVALRAAGHARASMRRGCDRRCSSPGLVTNLDDESVRRTAGNVGAQADIRLSALSALI